MPICHTFYYPFYYLLIHSSCAQAEPTCALEGLLFGLTKVAQDAYQVRSDSAITAHFSGNCTGVIRSFFRWSFQTLPILPRQELGQKASAEQLAAHAVTAVRGWEPNGC